MTTRQKIEGWIQEKIEALRSKGVTEADMQEEAFEELLTDNISARHFSEFRSDPELQKEILGAMLKHASPEYCANSLPSCVPRAMRTALL